MKLTLKSVCSLAVPILLLLFLSSLPAPLAAQDVQVNSADPPSAEQGTINLTVVIKGKGFKKGAIARFFLTGSEDPDGIEVTSTTWVSNGEVRANINVRDDATVSSFDVVVSNSDGRTGKGVGLFSVTEKGAQSDSGANCQVPLSVTFRDAPDDDTPNQDRIRSDGNGAYVHQDADKVYLTCDGKLLFLFSRNVIFEGFEPADAESPLVYVEGPGNLGVEIATLENGFHDLQLNQSAMTTKVQFNFEVASEKTRYRLGFWPGNDNDLYPGTDNLVVTRTAVDTWVIEAAPDHVGKLLKSPSKGKLRLEAVGNYNAPFRMTLVALPQ